MRSFVSCGMALAASASFKTSEGVVGDSPRYAASCFKLTGRLSPDLPDFADAALFPFRLFPPRPMAHILPIGQAKFKNRIRPPRETILDARFALVIYIA